jgi:hypothetical protein
MKNVRHGGKSGVSDKFGETARRISIGSSCWTSRNCNPDIDESAGGNQKLVKLKNFFSKKERRAAEVDELLKLPKPSEDGGSNREDMLNEVDKDILKRRKACEKESQELDRQIEDIQIMKESRRRRKKENALTRDRLEKELKEVRLRAMFQATLPSLRKISQGQLPSWRHKAFHRDSASQQALLYR